MSKENETDSLGEITDTVRSEFGRQYGMCNQRFKGIEDSQVEIRESVRAIARSQEEIAEAQNQQAVNMAELRAKVLNGVNDKIKNNSKSIDEQKQRVNRITAIGIGILITTIGTLVATLTLVVSTGG